MSLDVLLARLEKVRKSGAGYTARCPAHSDRSASLSVTEKEGGKVMVHCFALCPTPDVLAAVGLEMKDLFPKRLEAADSRDRDQVRRQMSQSHQWGAALEVLDWEATVVNIAAEDIAQGKAFTDEDRARLDQAIERIAAARSLLRPIDLGDMSKTLHHDREDKAVIAKAAADNTLHSHLTDKERDDLKRVVQRLDRLHQGEPAHA